MANKLTVLIAASESTPIVKVGGIADVVGSLPAALKQHNVDARIILPFYGSINTKQYKPKKINSFSVATDKGNETVTIYHTKDENKTDIYLLQNKTYLSTGDVYSWPGHKTSLFWEKQRFLFFAKALSISLDHLPFKPDVVHLNDWHTGLAAKLITDYPTVFTIHNLGYQGEWDKHEVVTFLQLNKKDFSKSAKLNPLLLGIENSGSITTVSPTYAKEILTPAYGEGLQSNLRKRKKDLVGILNGIDTNRFDPNTNKALPNNYSLKNLASKQTNKAALQQEAGLAQDADKPLLGVVSRLAGQKGIDVIAQTIPRLKKLGVQLIILGTGDPALEKTLTKLSREHKEWFTAMIAFDAKLAQRIYAGCDMFLIPSRYEPCGLTQMIAMRYGTVPIVRSTGGLADTVSHYTPQNKKATGFVFEKPTAKDLYAILQKAATTYTEKPTTWKQLQKNGMRTDFSWKKSAKDYIALYKKTIKQN